MQLCSMAIFRGNGFDLTFTKHCSVSSIFRLAFSSFFFFASFSCYCCYRFFFVEMLFSFPAAGFHFGASLPSPGHSFDRSLLLYLLQHPLPFTKNELIRKIKLVDFQSNVAPSASLLYILETDMKARHSENSTEKTEKKRDELRVSIVISSMAAVLHL